MVGAVRFELTTSCTPSKRAYQATLRPDRSHARYGTKREGHTKIPSDEFNNFSTSQRNERTAGAVRYHPISESRNLIESIVMPSATFAQDYDSYTATFGNADMTWDFPRRSVP